MSVQPRRLSVVTTSYPSTPSDPTGHFVLEDVRAHRRSGLEVTVLAPYDPRRVDADVTQLPHAGIFGWPGMAARLKQNPLRALGGALWMRALHTNLQRLQPEAVEVHWACPNALAVPRGMPTRLVSHGGDVRLLARLPADVAVHVMRDAVSWRFVADHLREAVRWRLPSSQRSRFDAMAYVAPSALGDVAVPDRARDELRAKHTLPLYVVVARLIASKEVERAVAHFNAQRPGGTLVIVGDGPERESLEQQARGHNVHFAGMCARADALVWIAAADELWMSSRTEGASTVVREAEALGTKTRQL